MDAFKFLREREYLCHSINGNCKICSLNQNKLNQPIYNKEMCNNFIFEYPACAVEIVDFEYGRRLAR